MKRMITVLAVLMAFSVTAANVKLSWDDANPEGTIAEYRVYQITPETNKLLAIVLYSGVRSNIQETVNLEPGTNEIAVTAVGTNKLESGFSDSVVAEVPHRPLRLRLPVSVTVPE